MSSGTLGTAMSTANTYVGVYTPTSAISYATISINLVNMDSSSSATVRVAIVSDVTDDLATIASKINASGTAANYNKYHIEYGASITGNGGVLERTCIPISPSDKVLVWASNPSVAIRVFGLEQV